MLKRYYQNQGFYNVKIKSSYAKNINNEYFELNFNIDSGEKYYFNKLNLSIDNNFEKENFKKIQKKINKLEGRKYSPKVLNKILEDLDNIVLSREFIFLNTKYDLVVTEKNKINIDFKFQDLEKFYVEQINIFGNYITEEKVIRNSLIVDEGDAFNKVLFDKSIDKIKSKRIFNSVKSNIKESKKDNKKKIIDIIVEETATGEIFAGAGTGTSGATITAGVQERNYLGKGISVSTNLTLSEEQVKGRFQVVNPNYKNTDRSLNTTIESTSNRHFTPGFKTSRTGFRIGTALSNILIFM